MTRRETLRAGVLTALGGLSLTDLLGAEQARPRRSGKAKSVILLYLLGGAATQDTWDLKPDAPAEVRGEFKPIPTSASGVQICEHLPRMARWMHRAALVRSVNHRAGCHNCLPSYTGYEATMPDQHPRDTDPPSMGSICEYLRIKEGRTEGRELPDYVYLPCWLGWGQAFRRAGPYGGFLGKTYDGLTTECNPFGDKEGDAPRPGYPKIVRGAPYLADVAMPSEMTIDRVQSRKGLLQQVDAELRRVERRHGAVPFDRTQERAFSLITSSQARAAFDLGHEDPRLIDRYGRTLFGQSTLIARRLVEAGVRFINVTWDLFWDRIQIDYDAWDTHTRNHAILKENKLPGLDQTFSALMEDLDSRGLLDETLIVVMSEMGRTPKINGNAGRDHWTFCYSVMFAGAGIRGGTVHGASDAQAAYVKDLPVSTGDVCATVLSCLGIDPEMTVPDRSGRPVMVANGGRAIGEIMA